MTFSTLVACGFPIPISTLLYARVMISPVFWTFGSANLRFWFKSAVEVSILGSKASSASIVHISTGAIPAAPSLLISIVVRSGSAKLLSLKSQTINPVLNLSKPLASVIEVVFVPNSNIVKLVTASRLSTLLAILPISRIVYLLLSFRVICGSLPAS